MKLSFCSVQHNPDGQALHRISGLQSLRPCQNLCMSPHISSTATQYERFCTLKLLHALCAAVGQAGGSGVW